MAERGDTRDQGSEAVRRQGVDTSARSFRPESKAEAFLFLEDSDQPAKPVEAAHADSSKLPRSAHLGQFNTSGSAPNLAGRLNYNDRKRQRARGPPTPARNTPVSLPPQSDGLSSGSTDHTFTRPPQSVNRGLATGSVPRRSKILPALPQEDETIPKSPASQATIPRPPQKDLFQAHRHKVIRGIGSPILEPPDLPGGCGENVSAPTPPENRERTRNVSEKLKTATDNDEIRHARLELWRLEEKEGIVATPGWSKPTFRRGLHVDDDPTSLRDYDAPIDRGRRKSRDSSPQSRPPALAMSRRVSSASVYSIVIQPLGPARELSPVSDAPSTSTASSGLHVSQEDMPHRIRRILQTRGDFSFHESDPDYSTFSPHGVSYHADLSLTIKALRNLADGELDDIDFDMEDG